MLLTEEHILVHGGYDAYFLPRAQQLAIFHWGYPAQACTSLNQTLVVAHQIMRTPAQAHRFSDLPGYTGSACVANDRLTCPDLLSQQFWQADQTGSICRSSRLTPQS
jgi:hypothetical protein